MTTPPANQPPPTTGRYIFIFLLGFVAGIIILVLAMRALESRKTWQDHYPVAVMQLMGAHMAKLGQQSNANRCTPSDVLPHLQALRILGNDLEPAYGELGSIQGFRTHASDFRGQLERILAQPPHNCTLLEQAHGEIGSACKACHQEFR